MDANVSIDLGKNTTELLEKLAQSLGMTVEKIFPYYVKQQAIEAYTAIGIGLAFFLVGGNIVYCRILLGTEKKVAN